MLLGGKPQDDAVIGGVCLAVESITLLETRGDCHRPWLMHATAISGMDDDPPVPLVVGATFDHHAAVIRHDAGGLPLLRQQSGEVFHGVVVQPVIVQAVCRGGVEPWMARFCGIRQPRADLPDESAFGRTEPAVPAAAVPMPERQTGRPARCRGDDHAVAGDLLNLPCGCTQGDDVADTGLVHHFLVEFPHSSRPFAPIRLGQHHGVQSAIWNRAAAGHGEPLRPGSGGDQVLIMVPHQAGTEGGEVLAVVGPRHHAHHRVERAAVEVAEGCRPAYRRIPVVRPEVLHRCGRDGLLGEHIQRVADHRYRFDVAGTHAFHAHRRPDDLLPGQRVDQRMGHPSDTMIRASDALQS